MSGVPPNSETSARRASRLSPIEPAKLLPWQRAHDLQGCSLYWLPVQCFPVPTQQKQWLLRFLDLLSERLKADFQLRCEIFLQQKTVEPLMGAFVKHAREFGPVQGLNRRPGVPLPAPPTNSDLEAFQDGRKQFEIGEFVADYCYWLLYKDPRRQRELFCGYGGLTAIFLKADPSTKAPELPFTPGLRAKFPMFQMVDIDKIFGGAFSLQDAFLKKSKELFGGDIEQNPQFSGLSFILPLLGTADFFAQPESESKKWFDLFDVYFRESPIDGGMLLASKSDLDECIFELLDTIAKENLEYPGA